VRGRGRCPVCFRRGLARTRSVPCRLPVPAMAPPDRRQRGSQPATFGRTAGGPPPPRRRGAAARRRGAVRALRVAEDRRPGDAAPSPESAVLDHEERAWLVAAINDLADGDREVIAARYFLHLTDAETGEIRSQAA